MSVLVFSTNGSYVSKPTLAAAATSADCANKTIVVTSPQSVTTSITWPADRALKFEKGGYITLSGAGALTGLPNARPQWFGAKGDGANDDTAAVQAAIEATRSAFGSVFIPNGTYKITSTIALSDGALPPPNIKGESARGVIFAPTMSGDAPCFQDKRTSTTFPNKPVVENFTIQPVTVNTGTAIEISGAVGEIFKNIYMNQPNYGIWLHDNSGDGTWTEANAFEDIWIDYANNAIRIEVGTGNGSFHGNEFNRVNMNIGAGQIGINHESGYWYNARFSIAMWAANNTAVLVNAQGNAESNIGSITLEMLAPGCNQAKITGTGRFWYSGPFNYVGGTINDLAGHSSDGSAVFSASNYRYSANMTDANLTAYTASIPTYNPNKVYNGIDSMGLWKLAKDGNYSYLLNGFGGGMFYTSNSGYNAPLESAVMGLAINMDGSAITSYSPGGLGLLTGPDKYAAFIKDGEFYISSPDRNTKVVSALGDPNGYITAGPGSVALGNGVGAGAMWVKQTGTDANGWGQVVVGGAVGGGNAATLNGFTSSQTPAAGQIPVLKSTGALAIPGSFFGGGTQHTFGQTAVYSQQIPLTSNQDVLLAYNDFFSGTITVTYSGTGALSVKSFTLSAADNHVPTSGDYLKLRQFFATVGSLGTPYVKFQSADGKVPHLYIPVTNTVADGVLTVTFISDIGHHPTILPASPTGTLGSATSLTGL